jgi:ribosomal protein S9
LQRWEVTGAAPSGQAEACRAGIAMILMSGG